MIKNSDSAPFPGRIYNYLGAKAQVVWIYNCSFRGFFVDIKYDGAREVTHLVKWSPTLFKKISR